MFSLFVRLIIIFSRNKRSPSEILFSPKGYWSFNYNWFARLWDDDMIV